GDRQGRPSCTTNRQRHRRRSRVRGGLQTRSFPERAPASRQTRGPRRGGLGAAVGIAQRVPVTARSRKQQCGATDLLLALRRGSRLRLVQRETGGILTDAPVPETFTGRALEGLTE